MQRLPAVLALVALAVPTSAGAKQVVALSLCGANGCHSTRDRQAVTAAMNAVSAADPNQAGPFFKLREVIGEPGQPGPIGQVRSWWIPSLEVIRNDNGGLAEFTQPQGAMKQALLGLSRGLRPFPAAKLPPEPGGAPAAEHAP